MKSLPSGLAHLLMPAGAECPFIAQDIATLATALAIADYRDVEVFDLLCQRMVVLNAPPGSLAQLLWACARIRQPHEGLLSHVCGRCQGRIAAKVLYL
jgi:hypothetical protein